MQAIFEHADNIDDFAFIFRVLGDNQLCTAEYVQTILEHSDNSHSIAFVFEILHNDQFFHRRKRTSYSRTCRH